MRIGFVINPIAGLGGTVALKGTDGLAKEAIRLGASPVSPKRAELFFTILDKNIDQVVRENLLFFIPKAPMGEQIIKNFNFKYKIIDLEFSTTETNANDTKNSIIYFEEEQVDLILFVGGDGTSVDVGLSIKKRTPMLGIPSGVKTYGSVFTHSPEEAVNVVLAFEFSRNVADAELLDLDENLYKKGILSISLKGIVPVPAYPEFFQNSKERIESSDSELDNLQRIAEEIINVLQEKKTKKLLIIGPGSTFTPLAQKIGISRSTLGVDCIEYDERYSSHLIISDAREDQIFNLLSQYNEVFILITPIGGMGYILGRGNHQISPRIVSAILKDHLLICCSTRKLHTLKDKILRIDTQDEDFNNSMVGYIRVITDIDQRKMIKVIH